MLNEWGRQPVGWAGGSGQVCAEGRRGGVRSQAMLCDVAAASHGLDEQSLLTGKGHYSMQCHVPVSVLVPLGKSLVIRVQVALLLQVRHVHVRR